MPRDPKPPSSRCAARAPCVLSIVVKTARTSTPRKTRLQIFRMILPLWMRPAKVTQDVNDELPDPLDDAARPETAVVALRCESTLRTQHRREDGENEHSSQDTFADLSHDPSS